MEPVGLAVGVFALAGLFNNAVDCFEYVQLGRDFEKDFTTCVLKLGDVKLRLSRWGQAVGLSGDLTHVEELNRMFSSQTTTTYVRERLEHILTLFADAKDISDKFKSGNKSQKPALQLCHPPKDLDPWVLSLCDKLHAISVKRQNNTSLRHKTKWALYTEKHFRKLIEDITSTVSNLVDLFPTADSTQKKLCDEEAAELVSDATRQVLEDIAAEQDKVLGAAIARMMKQQPHMINNWNNSDDTRVANQAASQTIHGGQTFNW